MERPQAPGPADPTTRRAALWATAVAVPVAVLVGWLLVATLTRTPVDPPASPTPARVQATTPVELAAPPLGEQSAQNCRKLVEALPGRIRDLPRRPVTAGPRQNAAYGDPPIILSCGAPATSFPPDDVVYVADGVCWHAPGAGQPAAVPPAAGQRTQWTTVDRQVPVRVVMPVGYEQPVQWLNEFSAAIARAIPALPTPPSGCAR